MENPFDDNYFMKKALQEAEIAFENDEVPVGAVIVVNNRIIGRAHNLTERLKDVTAHAEMQALTAASHALSSKYLPDCTLFVTLEPCVMCSGALFWSQIGRVVFGAHDEKRGFHSWKSLALHPKTEWTGGLLEQESSELLRSFFRARRK